MKVVVFSQDSPMRLHALLESIQLVKCSFIPTILYGASSESCAFGYREVSRYFPGMWVEKRDFNDDIKQIMASTVGGKLEQTTMFLTDACMFRHRYGAQAAYATLRNPDIVGINLSLSIDQPDCPRFDNRIFAKDRSTVNTWSWQAAAGDWGKPFTLLGGIYRTKHILDPLLSGTWHSPEQLESALTGFNGWCKIQKMACLVRNCLLVSKRCYDNELQAVRYAQGERIDVQATLDVLPFNSTVEYHLIYRPLYQC